MWVRVQRNFGGKGGVWEIVSEVKRSRRVECRYQAGKNTSGDWVKDASELLFLPCSDPARVSGGKLGRNK